MTATRGRTARVRRTNTARVRRTNVPLICVVCRQTIHAGAPYVQGLTREPYHRQCRALCGSLVSVAAPRFDGSLTRALPQDCCIECDEPLDHRRVRRDGRSYCRPCYRVVWL